jgi:acetate kinase
MLVINSGSSSIKYKLFGIGSGKVLAAGMVDRIGQKGSVAGDHAAAIDVILKKLPSDIAAVGHRVVHGGEEFKGPRLITEKTIKSIRKFSKLAPLHNPPNLAGIVACRKALPGVPQVAVFDTAFYQTLEERRYIYALPYDLYKKHGIRRYGFHGTSHKYVSQKAAEMLKRPSAGSRLITCHLGNGCSITAVKGGRAVDTSMGFTPLEGLVMGTRSGDVDPYIVLYLMENLGMSPQRVDRLLNKESGLLGVSGSSSDMRDIYKASKRNKRARLAFDIFTDRIKKYIGAFAAGMGGVDAIVFTGGIGENHAPTRKAVCKGLEFLRAKVLVVPTDEEYMIAQETRKVVGRL